MALVTLVLGVQWSQVWSLPLWLWRQHVELCRAHLARAKGGEPPCLT